MNTKEKFRTATLVIAIAVLVLALAAFSTSVSAQAGAGCNSTTIFNGTITGGIYFEQQGWMGNSPFTVTFNDVPDNITIARVYTGVWGGSPGKGGYFNITVNSNTSSDYKACDPCPGSPCEEYQNETCRCDALNWSNANPLSDTSVCHDYITGCNVQFISYNATGNITAGSNSITVRTWGGAGCTNGNWDGRIYLIALLVVYNDTSMPEMTYWINEGAPYMEQGSACDGPSDHHNISIYFNGSIPSNINTTKYWTLGFPHVANATTMQLNGSDIGYANHTESSGGYEVFCWWDSINASWFNTTNHFYYNDTSPNYERANVAVLKLSAESGSDLVVTDIEFPDTMRPNKNYTIKATIKNQGGANVTNQFNVSLLVNDSFYDKNTSITGLNGGASTTVSFARPVNLTYGCYTFKVVADSDGNVSESNENNNATSEKYQVGHVIVVKSIGDFNDLVNESKNGTLGSGNVSYNSSTDTYHLQNFTIENCAGRGIWIENTDKKFVINNCTAHNCKYGGVYLHNLSNGTINGSVVKDNSLKGIKVVKSKHVDITNNIVRNNSEYGIDVYPEAMPEVDCEYINITNNNNISKNLYGIELIGSNCTVRDNNVTNNSVYGIYVFGNDSEIYNNTIKYNDNYGIYLDNTTAHPCCENVIYENNFIDNKVGSLGHQGYDTGTTNHWNSTEESKNYTGNYWNDWQNNTGFPGNYTIDSGSNEDKRPKGLYDFLTGESKDKWAYGYEVFETPMPPETNNDPNNVFSSSNYSIISADDQTFQNDTAITNYHAAHRFNFSISEDRLSVKKINVTWNGIGTRFNNDGATLYIWNFESVPAEYKELANNSDANEVTLTGEKTGTETCYKYIDSSSGNMTILVVQNKDSGNPEAQKSTIRTDYVRVAITL